MQRHLILIAALLLSLSLAIPTLADRLPPNTRRDISKDQWTSYLRQTDRYSGLSQRIDATGNTLSETLFTRNFTVLPNDPPESQRVLLTLTYSNPSFRRSGQAVAKFIYQNGNPPTYGAPVAPNGTVLSPISDTIYFYPTSFGTWPGANVAETAPLFAIEKFMRDPTDSRFRMITLPVYLNSRFSYILLSRESTSNTYPPQSRFTNARTGTPLTKPQRKIDGSFAVVTQCVTASFAYKRSLRFTKHGVPLLLTGSKRIAMELPDGISVSFPKVVGAAVVGERVVFNVQWVVGEHKIFRGWTVYGTDGSFMHDCWATYYKVTV